jgi:hypothetical protein
MFRCYRGCGLVTSLGLNAPRAVLPARNQQSDPTHFSDSAGNGFAHQVVLATVAGRAKLVQMAAMATDECLRHSIPTTERFALLLCVAERDVPDVDGLEDKPSRLRPNSTTALRSRQLSYHGSSRSAVALRRLARWCRQGFRACSYRGRQHVAGLHWPPSNVGRLLKPITQWVHSGRSGALLVG